MRNEYNKRARAARKHMGRGLSSLAEHLEQRRLLSSSAFGPVTTSFLLSGNLAHANLTGVTTEAGDKTLAAGNARDISSGNFSLILAQYESNGSLDPTFGSGGTVVTTLGTSQRSYGRAVFQADGSKFVVPGTFGSGSNKENFSVFRYNANGTLDTSFGDGGHTSTTDFLTALRQNLDTTQVPDATFQSLYANHTEAFTAVIQADGKILAGGKVDGNRGWIIARFNTDGSLDSTFGTGGLVVSRTGTETGESYDSLAISNGIILQGGNQFYANDSGSFRPGVRAFNSDGTPDTAFGATDTLFSSLGQSFLDLGPRSNDPNFVGSGPESNLPRFTYAAVDAMAIQSDGKIIEAGWLQQYRNRQEVHAGARHQEFIGLFRFNSDGTVDQNFGGNANVPGMELLQVPGAVDSYALRVTVAPNGQIVAAGFAGDDSTGDHRAVVVRFNSDGTPDSNFGSGGIISLTDIPSHAGDENEGVIPNIDVAVQPDDQKIVVGTDTNNFATIAGDLAVYRLQTNGALDTGFSGNSSTAAEPPFQVQQTLLTGAGQTLAAGNSLVSGAGTTAPTLALLDSQGVSEAGFGSAGYVRSALFDQQTDTLTLLPSSTAGAEPITGDEFTVTLTLANGNTHAVSAIASSENASAVMTELAQGLQTIAGAFHVSATATGSHLTITGDSGFRFTTTLSLTDANATPNSTSDDVPTFAVTTAFSGSWISNAEVLQPDGKIIVVGSENSLFGLARYNSDGTIDPTFGPGDGSVISTIDFGSPATAWGATLDAQGRIIVVGTANGNFALARFNSNGTIDTTFGANGIATTELGTANDVAVTPLALADGSILVAGTYTNNGQLLAVARYLANGSLDTAFGSGGILAPGLIAINASDAHGLALDGQKILLAGGIQSASNEDFAVGRFNLNGTNDPTFGNNGIATFDFGGTDDADSVVLQGNDIVVTGTSLASGVFSTAIVAFTQTGAVDPQIAPQLLPSGIPSAPAAGAQVLHPFLTSGIFVYGSQGSDGTAPGSVTITDNTTNGTSSRSRISTASVEAPPANADLSATIGGVKSGSFIDGLSKGKATVHVLDSNFSGAVDVRLLLSSDSTVQDAVAELGDFTLVMKSNKAKSHTFKFIYPASIPDGAYQVLVVVDPSNQINETDESNNTAAAEAIELGPPIVDLAAGPFSGLKAQYLSSKSISVKVSVSEEGNVPTSGPVTVSLYLSSDGTTLGQLLATKSSAGKIKPSKHKVFTLKVPPNTVAPGQYYFIAIVSNALDANGGNNQVVSGIVTIV